MISNTYEAMVQMKPKMENYHFFTGDDDFTYQVPRVYFECMGDINHSPSAFDWKDDSVIVFKDNCAVRYTERNSYEMLMVDDEGVGTWVDGWVVDIMGWDINNVEELPVKSYMIEEFDWNKNEKRRYKVILEETTRLEEYDEVYLKKVIARDREEDCREYILTQS